MKKFDEAVSGAAAAFRRTGWEWETRDGPYIPTEGAIRDELLGFLRRLRRLPALDGRASIESGRLRVERDPDLGIILYLNLATIQPEELLKLLKGGK